MPLSVVSSCRGGGVLLPISTRQLRTARVLQRNLRGAIA